jgi:hypothetical protein
MKMKALGTVGLMLVLLSAAPILGMAEQAGGEVTLPEGTRLSLQLNDHLSTKLNSEGDKFTANVIVPIYQGDRLVIPKGSTINGSVSRVLRPGRIKGKAVMNLLFQSIRIPGRGELPIVASLARVDSEGNAGVEGEGSVKGEGSVGSDVARVLKPGLAGAGIGGLAGGGKGAAIGSGVGAIVGLATVFSTRGKDLEMRRGSTMDIALDRALTIPTDTDVRGAHIR